MTVLNEGTDALNTISTPASMQAGDFFFGTLDTANDSDWIEVSLVAGQTYTFGLVGVGALSDSLSDPYLRLRDGADTAGDGRGGVGGGEIAFDDDGGPGRTSSLTFIATTTGTYYLDVQSWNNTQAGDYGLSMAIGDRASFDVTMGAGNLIRDDASWGAAPGTGTTVTWSIRDTGTEPSGGNPFVAPSAAQVDAIEATMGYIAGVTGLTFSQVNAGGTSNNATMVFGSYSANDGSGAYAYFPGNDAVGANSGDVWLNNTSVSTTNLNIGSYSYFTILHEIGHALGLAHPGDYNAAPGVSITYSGNAQFIQDTHQYTVMSYFDESYTTTSVGGYPDTLMLYDLYALHQQYGADLSYHAGNTVYGFNASVGGAYDFTTNTNPLLSIWDGGGIDTVDLSGYSAAQILSLMAGTFSSIGGFVDNVSIAVGAIIENAVGGSGNDVITGNDVNNTLAGGDGFDTLAGGNGQDRLEGGIGNDSLQGNAGNDTIYGQSGDDSLGGGQDNDLVEGGDGNDTLKGGKGEDTLNGGGDADSLKGANGNDRLQGNQGNDTLYGDAGDDVLGGGQGNDALFAGDGADTLRGGKGDDTLTGGSDADSFVFQNGWGADVIQDFEDDVDQISLLRFGLADVTTALGFATQQNNDVVFDFEDGDILTVLNTLKGDLENVLFIG